MKFTTLKESHIYLKFFFCQNLASERLTLVYRASTQLAIRFVPVFGATQYSIVARNTEAGFAPAYVKLSYSVIYVPSR